jgi:hypothetical protein
MLGGLFWLRNVSVLFQPRAARKRSRNSTAIPRALRLGRVPLVALALLAGNIGLANSGRIEAAPPPPSGSVGHVSWVIADFDGDSKPDIAISRMEVKGAGYVYWLELDLSTTRDSGSPQGGAGVPDAATSVFGLHLTPRDVDGDHDLDIVVTSGIMRRPVAVWINDGKGRFEEGDLAAYPALTWSDDAIVSSQRPPEPARDMCDQTQRSRFGLPFGSSLQGPFLRSDIRLVWPPAAPISHFSADRSSPRAPPSHL